MTARRPHWDDELIEAVADMAWGVNPKNEGRYGRTFFEMTYDVIAAVEDWHRDRWTGVCESPEEVVRELKQAQAAIQRVLGLHHFVVDEIETREGPEDVQHCSECGYIPTDEEPCPTIRTLDGASTCAPSGVRH